MKTLILILLFAASTLGQDAVTRHLLYGNDVPVINLDLQRDGVATDQTTLTVASNQANFVIDTIPTLKIPQLTLMSDFNLLGNDYYGFIGKRANGKYYRTTDGTTFTEVLPDTTIAQMYCDDFGNKYIKTSDYDPSIYRATKDSWNFTKAFTYYSGYTEWLSFSCSDSIIMFAAYGAINAEANRGIQMAISKNAGQSWDTLTIDYNQRHLHFCIFNPNSKKMYLGVGEYSTTKTKNFRGVLVSADTGQTWTQVVYPTGATYDAQKQYGAMYYKGTDVYFGTDVAPTQFFKMDSSNNITLIPANTIAGAGYLALDQGFQLGMTQSDGLLYVMGTSNSTNPTFNAYLYVIDTTTMVPSVIWSPKWVDQRTEYRLLKTPSTNVFAIKDVQNKTSKSYIVTKSDIENKSYYYVGKSADTLKVMGWDGQADVIPTTYGGLPIVKIHKVASVNNGGYFNVTNNQYVDLTLLVKKQTGGTLRMVLYWGNSVGGQIGTYTPYLYLTAIQDTANFHKLTIPRILIPDSTGGQAVAKMKVLFYITDGSTIDVDPTNFHYMVGRVVVSKSNQTNDPTWFGTTSYTDTINFSFNQNLTGNYLFKDRIYQLGRNINWSAGFGTNLLALYGQDTIEIGIGRPVDSTHYASAIYVKEGGDTLGLVKGGLWGGSINMDKKSIAKITAVDGLTDMVTLYNNGVIPAPIIVGITKTKIYIYSPETGIITSFNLAKELTGNITGRLLGDAYHRPEIFETIDIVNKLLDY